MTITPRSPLVQWRILRHQRARQADDVEGADQVNADDRFKNVERMRSAAARCADGGADAGAVDERVEAAEFRKREGKRLLDVSSSLVTSALKKRALSPSVLAASAESLLIVAVEDDDARAIVARIALAVAAPRPEAPPVTMAMASRIFIGLCLLKETGDGPKGTLSGRIKYALKCFVCGKLRS